MQNRSVVFQLLLLNSLLMLAYKFKIGFEDHEHFLREIVLLSDQSFEDFHQALLGNLGLDTGMLASFFICDQRFRKQLEIRYAASEADNSGRTGDNEGGADDESENNGEGNNVNKSLLMHDCLLKDYIDDPHQRLIFVYDYLNQWTFYVELMRIVRADEERTYPSITKIVGPVPRELMATPGQIPGVETTKGFSFGDGQAPPEDLSDFDEYMHHQDDLPGETGLDPENGEDAYDSKE